MKLKHQLLSLLGCATLMLASSCTDDALDNGANNGQSPEADSNVVTLTVLDGASQQGRIHTPAAPNTRALKSQRLQYVATIEPSDWHKDHIWSATSVCIDDATKQVYVTWHSDRQATNEAKTWGGGLDIIDITNENKPTLKTFLGNENLLKFNNVMENSGKLYLSAMHPRKGGVVARVDLTDPTTADLIGFPGSSVNAIALSDEKLMVVSGFKGTYGIVNPSQLPTEYDYDNPNSDANQYVTLYQPMDKDFGGKYVAVDEGGRAFILRQNGDKGEIIDVKSGNTIPMSEPLLSEEKYAEDYDPATGNWITEGTRQSVYFGKHVMVVRKGYAYVAAGKSGIFKYNLTNEEETKINGIFATGLYADDEFLYAATGSGLRIYKFNDETGELPLYAFEVETYDEAGNGAPTSTTAATTGAKTEKRHSPNFVTAHKNGGNTYIYIAYGQSGVRVYKFKKDGEEQPEEDHPWVDPGDDSDIVWAEENVEGYYAWGEIFHAASGNNTLETFEEEPNAEFTSPDGVVVKNNASYWARKDGQYTHKVAYTHDNYRYVDGTFTVGDYYDEGRDETRTGNFATITKYHLNGKTILDPEDDVATMRWGNGWRMPTIDEWNSMINSSTVYNAKDDETGRTGFVFVFENGEELFLPHTGFYDSLNSSDPGIWKNGDECYYWSSTLSDYPNKPFDGLGTTGGWVYTEKDNKLEKLGWSNDAWAWMPDLYYFYEPNGYDRAKGFKVRPVKDKKNMPDDFPEWQDK